MPTYMGCLFSIGAYYPDHTLIVGYTAFLAHAHRLFLQSIHALNFDLHQKYIFVRDEMNKYDQGNNSVKEGVADEIEPEVDSELRLGPPGPPFGIVINGSSLVRRHLP